MAHELATKPYADYAWYTDTYCGTLLMTEAIFNRYARWASYLVDNVTYGNIKSDDLITDCVKDATCAAAELAYNYWQNSVNVDGGKGAKSETNDGYTITYDDSILSAEALQKQAIAQIRLYLQNSGLLFRGVKVRRWFPW